MSSSASPPNFVNCRLRGTSAAGGMVLGLAGAMGSDAENRSRHELLWNRMSVASRGTLNAVDKNEFVECFPQFTLKEKEKLFLIYTRVVAKMQEHVMLDFKARCEAWELKEILEELEELEQQREGDGLSFRSTPLTDAVRGVTTKIKQEEVDRLKLLVPKEEELVAQLKLRREALQARAREAEPTALAAYLAKVSKEREELHPANMEPLGSINLVDV